MYRTTKQSSIPTNTAKCDECGSTRLRWGQGKLVCTNCDHLIHQEKRRNKYNASKATYQGIKYDSTFEATVAAELELMKKANAIKDWERQFKVEMWAHRPDGKPAFKVTHKVDFRVTHNDGSYELIEAKGIETADYQMRRKFLEFIWLPMHKDHRYTVRKQY